MTQRAAHSAAAPALSLVVPAYNEADYLPALLASVAIARMRSSRGPVEVIVADIARDALWENIRDVVLAAGLRSCWSTLIHASDGRILGTLAARLAESGERWGVAAICIGVGQALAVVLENISGARS